MNENDFEFLTDVKDADIVALTEQELNQKLADAQYKELCDRYGEDDRYRPLILD